MLMRGLRENDGIANSGDETARHLAPESLTSPLSQHSITGVSRKTLAISRFL